MNSLIPPLGTSGLYTVSAPYQTLIDAKTTYTCEATRYLQDYIKLGIDPYSLYYQPYGIDQTVYNTELASKNVAICSLMASNGTWVYIPSSHITSYPNPNGISYTPMILGISLGAIPDYLDLSSLKSKMVSLVRENIGITSDVREVKVGKSKQITQADHNSIETIRTSNITDSTTDRAKYLKEVALNAKLTAQINQLQEYIKTHIPP